MRTLAGLFDTRSDATETIEELIERGIPRSDISIVSNDSSGWYDEDSREEAGAEAGAGIGAIGYLKTDDGIFQQGGPWKPLYMVGLDYRVPLWTKWDLLISGRVDGHSFTTDELKAQGFTNSQGVQRVFLGVGLAGVRK